MNEFEAVQAKAEIEREYGELRNAIAAARSDASVTTTLGGLNEIVRERDALKAELAARPVVEGEAARELRHFLLEHSAQRLEFARSWEHGYKLVSLLYRLRASAPPASLPVREVVVERPEARKLWERLQSPYALPFVSPTDWATRDYKHTAEILRAFRDSAPPASAASEDELRRQLSDSLDREARLRMKLEEASTGLDVLKQRDTQRLVQIAEYQDRAMKAEEGLDVARAELAAAREASLSLKRNFEGLPDLAVHGTHEAIEYLRAKLTLAPHSEYVRAAVTLADLYLRSNDEPQRHVLEAFGNACVAFRSLYDARKRGEQERANTPGVVEESTFASKAVEFAPPPAERVTVYVVHAAGSAGIYLCSADYPPRSNERVLALDARVVAKGGAS